MDAITDVNLDTKKYANVDAKVEAKVGVKVGTKMGGIGTRQKWMQ